MTSARTAVQMRFRLSREQGSVVTRLKQECWRATRVCTVNGRYITDCHLIFRRCVKAAEVQQPPLRNSSCNVRCCAHVPLSCHAHQ